MEHVYASASPAPNLYDCRLLSGGGELVFGGGQVGNVAQDFAGGQVGLGGGAFAVGHVANEALGRLVGGLLGGALAEQVI